MSLTRAQLPAGSAHIPEAYKGLAGKHQNLGKSWFSESLIISVWFILFQNLPKEIDRSFLLKTQDRQDAVFKMTFINPINT